MGVTPGIGVMMGWFEAIAPVTNVGAGGIERAGVHVLARRQPSGTLHTARPSARFV
jgi:hypothetical protein